MMKSEFEERTGVVVNQEDYELIEIVYTYYPQIGDKDQFAKLYKTFGFRIIQDFLPRALKMKDTENEIRQLQKLIAEHQTRISELSKIIREG